MGFDIELQGGFDFKYKTKLEFMDKILNWNMNSLFFIQYISNHNSVTEGSAIL